MFIICLKICFVSLVNAFIHNLKKTVCKCIRCNKLVYMKSCKYIRLQKKNCMCAFYWVLIFFFTLLSNKYYLMH